MTHKPIKFNHINFVLPHKACFTDFSETILYGQRIAIVGKNGSGKSTLLKMLLGLIEPSSGEIMMPQDVRVGYVPQLPENHPSQSGGEQFNQALTKALAPTPNLLILDEPTNHLDRKNRLSLLRMLKAFPHTLIVCSHDVEVLKGSFDKIFFFDDYFA
jgi:ATPase subunit of ABC transporter with duplicated ATPase domains